MHCGLSAHTWSSGRRLSSAVVGSEFVPNSSPESSRFSIRPGKSLSMGERKVERRKMASHKRVTINEFDYEAVLLDIEGTTTPISFVKVNDHLYIYKLENEQ